MGMAPRDPSAEKLAKAVDRLAKATEHQNQLTIEVARFNQTFAQGLMGSEEPAPDGEVTKIPAYLLGREGEPLPNSETTPSGYAKITEDGITIHIPKHNYTFALQEVLERHEPVGVTIGVNYREKD